MNVLLDGVPLIDPGNSLESALRAGAREAAAKGRMIVELEVDGAALWGDALENAMRCDAAPPPNEVSLVSADPKSLARLTLMDAADGLELSAADHRAAAEALQIGDSPGAMGKLPKIFAAWQAARDAYQRSTALLAIPSDSVSARTPDGRSVAAAECAAGLARRLHAARGAVETGDWSALADTLAYDLTEDIEVWAALLRATADRIAGTV